MNGTGVAMRSVELEGRSTKQPAGSAETREVKLVTVWSAGGLTFAPAIAAAVSAGPNRRDGRSPACEDVPEPECRTGRCASSNLSEATQDAEEADR